MLLLTKYSNPFKRLHLNYELIYLTIFVFYCQTSLSSPSALSQPSSLGVYMVRSPESLVAPKGDEVLFECELNLEPDRLEWRFRHSNVKLNRKIFYYLHKNEGYNISNEDGTSKLRISVNSDTLGDYQCVAWFGTAAIASVTAKLTLASISLGEVGGNRHGGNNRPSQTLRWKVYPSNSVLIRCGNVVSNPPPVWSFYKDNIPLPQSESQIPTGALVLNSVSSKDSGIYSCSAVNAITGNEIQLPQKIDLNIEHTPKTAPHFLSQPTTLFTARPGQTIVLECPGVGNPPPKAVWSSPDVNMSHSQVINLSYGLQIFDVSSKDRGTYICRLDNGVSQALVHTIRLEILEQPIILKGPSSTLTNESDALELDCAVRGYPTPDVYWMINGVDTSTDNAIRHEGSKMIIKSVEKKHAGIVQCFARNEVGETSESNLLKVNPKQIPGEIGMQPLGPFPTKSTFEHIGKQNKGRKKHKLANMIPPSRPNVTRLSDDSVMLRWYVPKNDGLTIQFFKVQYRMLGDISKTIPRENWQTLNDDIQYGKPDKNNDGIKNFTSSVTGLKPDRYYRFRIIAVYSNNDNKEGNSSGKFLLQRGSQLGPTKGHLAAPTLTKVEGVSDTAVVLHWAFPFNKSNSVDGFYAYYRSAATAGEYTKATIEGMHTRHFKIDMLEPETVYEFKLQSFTASSASEFSSILTGKTLKPPTPPPQITPSVIPASKASEDNNSMFPVIAGAAGGGLLLLLAAIVACFCVKRRKSSQQEDEDKPQLDHIQAEATHFVPPVMGNQHHKPTHRMNGVTTRMNITPNPLAQDGDKNRNVMELRFMPTTGGSNHHQVGTPSPTSAAGGPMLQSSMTGIPTPTGHHHHTNIHIPLQQHQPYHPPQTPTILHKQQQNNNHHPHHFQAPLTPSLDQHRRTLERSARNLHYPSPGADVSADSLPTRIPSLRRTRRTSGSANNNTGGVGVPGSPRVQRSPMPVRAVTAAAIKRNRLGSHTENMSSGSLNSIEV